MSEMKCDHEWVVFSVAYEEGWLMLQCVKCGDEATVNEHSAAEWAKAYDAPTDPYEWRDNSRVVLRPERRTNFKWYVDKVDGRYIGPQPREGFNPTAQAKEIKALLADGVTDPYGFVPKAMSELTKHPKHPGAAYMVSCALLTMRRYARDRAKNN